MHRGAIKPLLIDARDFVRIVAMGFPTPRAMCYAARMSTPDDFLAVPLPSRYALRAKLLFTVVAVALAALSMAACGDGAAEPAPTPNRAPMASGLIPDKTVAVGETTDVNVGGYFTDPDGDALTFAATSTNPRTATVAVSASVVTVTAIERGMVTVAVTARDPGGLSAQATFAVRVPNQAPVALDTVPAQTVFIGDTVQMDMAAYFTDPDGDALSYSAASSNADAVLASVAGSVVSINAIAAGTAVITVAVTDPDGLSAQNSFEVTVPNRAPVAVDSLPSRTVPSGEMVTVDLAPFFSDPDGDPLTYAASSSDTAVARIMSLEGSLATAAAVGVGETVLTYTATDPGGLFASLWVQLIVVSDRPALMALYDGTRGTWWRRNDYWATSAPLSDWYGITVRGPTVTGMALPDNRLRGVLPPELGNLGELEWLDLSDNEFCPGTPSGSRWCVGLSRIVGNGRLARPYGPIPPSFGNLPSLRRLDLSRSGITGPIPPELGLYDPMPSKVVRR